MRTVKPDEQYSCVIKRPPKKTKLRSVTRKIPVRVIHVEGFTIQSDGSDVPNGISFLACVRGS